MQTAVSIGSSILGALLGRKALSATNLQSRGQRGALGDAHGPRIAGCHARRGKHRSAAATVRRIRSVRSTRKSRASKPRSMPATISLRARRSPGTQIRHRRRRGRVGMGSVAQGRRRISRPGLRLTAQPKDALMKELIDSLTKDSRHQRRSGRRRRGGAAEGREGQARRRRVRQPARQRARSSRPAEEGARLGRWRGLGGLLGGLAGAIGGNAALISTIVSGFGKLGLKPEDAKKFVPVILGFLRTKVGPDVVSSLEKTLRA